MLHNCPHALGDNSNPIDGHRWSIDAHRKKLRWPSMGHRWPIDGPSMAHRWASMGPSMGLNGVSVREYTNLEADSLGDVF